MAEQNSGRDGVETFEVGGTTFHRVALAPGAEDEDEIDLAFFGEKAPRMTPLRNRPYKNPESEESRDARERRPKMVTVLPAFGENRVFPSVRAFFEDWKPYEREHHTKSTQRDSKTARTYNVNREKDQLAAGLPIDQAFLDGHLPLEVGMHHLTRRCHRSIRRVPRPSKDPNKKKRKVKNLLFTDCPARITLTVRKTDTGEMEFVTSNEIHVHNHACTVDTMNSVASAAEALEESGAMGEIIASIQAGARASNICDTIAARWGIQLTPKQLANLKRDRLGGKPAVVNLKLLLERFSSFEGSHCLIVEDQEEEVCAIGVQSAAQRAMFERYGDNLILDWTHNTNNLGFYLGSLVCTSATGRGMSVFDFLCVEQTKAMMSTVLEHFIATNPSAREKILSFVIDKDYKEWAVLMSLFPSARVLLCQFHVVSWFASVVTKKKYGISGALRDKVLHVLYGMVYVRTIFDFDQLQEKLEDLLADRSPSFLQYMDERWFGCRKMWSNCERETVFTALNTTSNRIESGWNQLKKILGKKLRIDLCLEAIFAYQTAVLRREYRLFNTHATRLVLLSETDPFIRAAAAELGDYAANQIHKQWQACVDHGVTNPRGYSAYVSGSDSTQFAVARRVAESSTYTVNTNNWKCSCGFQVTSALPCRHLMFVARHVLRLPQLPPDCIVDRWRMAEAATLVPLLRLRTAEIQSLRTSLLLADRAFSQLIDRHDAGSDSEDESRVVPGNIVHFRMRRHEQSDLVVLTNLEKRNIVDAESAKITAYLMAQSTPQFLRLATELRDILKATLKKWRGESSGKDLAGCSEPPVPKGPDECDDIDEVISAALGDDGREEARGLQLRHDELVQHRSPSPCQRQSERETQHHETQHSDSEMKHNEPDRETQHSDGETEQSETQHHETQRREHTETQHHEKQHSEPDHETKDSEPGHETQRHEIPHGDYGLANNQLDGVRRSASKHGPCQRNHVTNQSKMGPSEAEIPFPFGDLSEVTEVLDRLVPAVPPVVSPVASISVSVLSNIMTSVADFQLRDDAPANLGSPPSQSVGRSTRVAAPVVRPAAQQVRSMRDLLGSDYESDEHSDAEAVGRQTNGTSPQPSISASAISAVMTDVAAFNLRDTGRTSEPGKKPAHVPVFSRSINAIRDILCSDGESSAGSDTTACSGTKRRRASAGRISMKKLPVPLGVGATKKLKTTGATGRREAPVCQTSDCPVDLHRFAFALENTPNIGNVQRLWEQYPVLFTASFLQRREICVAQERVDSRVFHVNFSVPDPFRARLEKAINTAVAEQGTSGDRVSLLDESGATVSNQFVARVAGGGQARGFSAANVSDFASFNRLKMLLHSHRKDERWLQGDGDAQHPLIPYAEPILLARRAPGDADHVSLGARASILAVLKSCSLRTRFRVQGPGQARSMEIAVHDILGRLGRTARLNDAVLMYALQQMASDYPDVCVFECLPCPTSPPAMLLRNARTLVFPFNYGQAHWCVICVTLAAGVIVDVGLYDPLQGAYEASLRRSWMTVCVPLLTLWHKRDDVALSPELELTALRVVKLTPQHDHDSCGVYCIAVVYDFVSNTAFFQHAGGVGASAACQLRVRVMWRIFCCSIRLDAERDEIQAKQTIEHFEQFAQVAMN